MIISPKNLSTKFSFKVNKKRIQTKYLPFSDSQLHSLFGEKNCYLCDEKTKEYRYFCDNCYLDLPKLQARCFNCCLPLKLEAHDSFPNNLVCGECISNPPSFRKTFCAFEYQFPINQIVKRIKYSKQRYWISSLSRALSNEIILASHDSNNFTWPDMLIPIPIHKSKKKIRGYNQAELIADFLSKQLDIPIAKKTLLKIKNTTTQAQLNRQERMKNLGGSFSISKKRSQQERLIGKHIALVDDVLTTKATCELASKLLLASGASVVDVWCLARTPKEK